MNDPSMLYSCMAADCAALFCLTVAILADRKCGYTCAWRTSRLYPTLTYQVQYGETDFQFIQRLM